MRVVRRVLAAWRRFYGANPLHLLVLVGSFALVYGVFLALEPDPTFPQILLWFVGAVIAHDLVLFPLYALADRGLLLARWLRRRVPVRPVTVPATNHVRVPVLGSLLMLGVFWPSISTAGEQAYRFASGASYASYYDRWLVATGVLFLVSAVVYALRVGRTHVSPRRRTDGGSRDEQPEPDEGPGDAQA